MKTRGDKPTGRLLAINPSDPSAREFALVKREVSVGSGEENDLVIRNGTVSRRHAVIRTRRDQLEVEDLGSTNGTFVNGKRVTKIAEFERGDELRFGAACYVLVRTDSAAGARPRRRKWPISPRTVAEIVLVAFIVGFGVAQYLTYLLYHEENKLLLAKAVPVPSAQLPRLAPSPEGKTPESKPITRAVTPPTVSTPPAEHHPSAQATAAPPPATVPASDAGAEDRDYAGAIALANLLVGDNKEAGRRAPDFSVQDLKGNSVALSSLRGKVVLLNVWATWCGVCRSEMPSLEKLYRELKDYPDFALLAVSIDQGNQAKVASFLEKNGYDFPTMVDQSGELSSKYNVRGVPVTYVIDHRGRIAWSVTGGVDLSDERVIQALQKML